MTAPGQALRVAVIDRDHGFLQVLGRRLADAGAVCRGLAEPAQADVLTGLDVQAVIVDPALAGPAGRDYLRRLAGELPPHVAVVVCTGPSSVAERVSGLRAGADDWVTKPCHPEEVVARVEAIVRRASAAGGAGGEETLLAGELEIAPGRRRALAAGRGVGLTRRELELLCLLADHPDQVLAREEIYRRVWGYALARGDRSVDVFVRRLRHKLKRASPGWRYLHTHFGIGYRFAAEPVEPVEPHPASAPAGVRSPTTRAMT
jgi:DNA-binding response OmpR family regulator